MTLKRQLLLISLLALMLPWAGCEFIRETETALRAGQQQMLTGAAQAIATSVSQYDEEFPHYADANYGTGDQLFGHPLETMPRIDGYFDDWPLDRSSLRSLPGTVGPIRVITGVAGDFVYLYVEVPDTDVVYTNDHSQGSGSVGQHADRVTLINGRPPYLTESFSFIAEAPGTIFPTIHNEYGFAPEPAIHAWWQDAPGGYQLEARIPRNLLGTHLGIEVHNTSSPDNAGVRSASFSTQLPGPFITPSTELADIANGLVLPGMRLILTDAAGWRVASVGELPSRFAATRASNWLRFAYDTLVEPGRNIAFAEPDPGGREQQPYVSIALGGKPSDAWFRSQNDGRAIVAVAQPITVGETLLGVVVLQQNTDAILSLTNQTLARLMNVTMIAMFLVAGGLIAYASFLSRRIRKLSLATEAALEGDSLSIVLPSAGAGDEIGDLSRSFSYVLGQLGDYNEYLRSLASKLSHELRTPLAIVMSSLENLEHESQSEAAAGYTARAKDGAERLRKILSAMSEASRVEELMKNSTAETFELRGVLASTASAYQDIYTNRDIAFECNDSGGSDPYPTSGSPELLIQMIDKLVDNAVGFSATGDAIRLRLSRADGDIRIDISNPGPPLPERMRTQLFDSMVSIREQRDDKHLGLGLYIAKLIAEGHNGHIDARNIDGGVQFSIRLPPAD